MKHHNIADRTGVRVMRELCPTCIFHPGNRMHLNKGRVAGMVRDALARDGGTIPCHETFDDKLQAICRGFYDAHGDRVQLLQIAQRLGFIIEHERSVAPGEMDGEDDRRQT